ncbi:hormogonium polysaccharide biosynthesis protein HpsL [Aphanothece sacrum]|uniref:Bacterial cell division membrane protein n=1 Tax=Aphanothece sacrum FPU1 TaxID=1920663 RepID=A0A401IJB7_APHSA|nr:hormogonium polysaccharide biosynthesis protein HpsL [Aphanothece sacrum]GBF81306.1 bacterial cell division membrane protein [Aphanothece sacrum FPU1]GBF83344.1 bacterial cell division membrane protein [Aphanothece sacrum FPU3]
MLRTKRKKKASKNQAESSSVDIKQKLAEKRQAKEARQKLISLIAFSLFFGIIVGVPGILIAGIKVGLGIIIGIPILVISYNYPRLALWSFLIYMPFSGTATYWIGGGNSLFQVSKDIFYLPALVALVQECRRKRKPIIIPKNIVPSLILLLVAALLTLFLVNGMQQFIIECNDPNFQKFLVNANGDYVLNAQGVVIKNACKSGIPFLQGILGLKVLMGYIPLIFCAYYLVEDKKQLLTLGRLLVTLAIICCILGLAQYWMLKTGRCKGTDHLSGLELFKPRLDAKCLVGGALLYSPSQGQIRLPGTFVSPWHWSWFLIGNAATCFATTFSETSFFWRMGGLVGIALVFLNAVVCGQRLALAAVPGIIFLLLILTGQIANLKKFLPILIGLSVVLLIGFSFVNPDFFQERIDSLVGRWNTSPPTVFIQEQFNFSLKNLKGTLSILFGNGLGTATNSTRIFGDISLVETYHPKLLFEIGFFGLAAFMIFITHLTFLAFKSYRSLKDKSLRSFASSFWVFMLIIAYFPYWYPLDTDPVALYYWMFAGIIFKLPIIDQQEQAKLKAEKESAQGNKKTVIRGQQKHSIS